MPSRVPCLQLRRSDSAWSEHGCMLISPLRQWVVGYYCGRRPSEYLPNGCLTRGVNPASPGSSHRRSNPRKHKWIHCNLLHQTSTHTSTHIRLAIPNSLIAPFTRMHARTHQFITLLDYLNAEGSRKRAGKRNGLQHGSVMRLKIPTPLFLRIIGRALARWQQRCSLVLAVGTLGGVF